MLSNDVIEIIAGLSVIPQEEVNADDILANIGIDSLKRVELIIALEEGFNIRFDDSDLNPIELNTIKDIIKLVEKYVK